MFVYTPPADLLKGRVILVTGAGSGIGRAVSKSFAAHGATVILLGRTLKKLEAVYDEIESAGYPQAAIYPMNLEGASPKDYEDLAATLKSEFGRLDGLLHNASLLGTLTPLVNYDITMWYQVLQVNLNAPFMLTKACFDLLKAAPEASVLFTSSGVGRKGRAYWGAYAVSKFATEGFMQTFAEELETNTAIRVNSISPGATRTSMRRAAYPAENPETLPLPEDITGLYLYLMGSESRGIHGQALSVRDNSLEELQAIHSHSPMAE
ncbi:YciK family oxidoreductase [Thioflexithrix psekupsensis]|uniref:YciK family oxidoreductase n=1 Tax=Thioflexithrix psekupsensis TaxID=1570016 RepID=A0A251XCZ4_9GAMM|nr:YciK family oxidoreductase [Thioflexithrix psekupsensis]OUD16245.1 YciK family oxidoreductase [Thioflexithrix psekupsensis]